jgi:lysyl-tRNA synthetase class II
VSPLARTTTIRSSSTTSSSTSRSQLAKRLLELNDPDDQRGRTSPARNRAKGDGEAHPMDEDYVRLRHGMPPAAGCGTSA